MKKIGAESTKDLAFVESGMDAKLFTYQLYDPE